MIPGEQILMAFAHCFTFFVSLPDQFDSFHGKQLKQINKNCRSLGRDKLLQF